jgi:hypothetical protein
MGKAVHEPRNAAEAAPGSNHPIKDSKRAGGGQRAARYVCGQIFWHR